MHDRLRQAGGQDRYGVSLSVKTISTYRTHILRKLNLQNNSEMTRFAMDNHLGVPDGAAPGCQFAPGAQKLCYSFPPAEKAKKKKSGAELTAGIRYLLGNRFVLYLLYLTVSVTFFTRTPQVLFISIVLSLADAATLGQVQSITASGLLMSSLLIGLRSKAGEQKKNSAAFAVLGRHLLRPDRRRHECGGDHPGRVRFFLALPFVNTSLEVLFRQEIQKELQGRVWSLISLVSQLGMLTAFALAGPLADRVFNPLLTADGPLAGGSVGRWIGHRCCGVQRTASVLCG